MLFVSWVLKPFTLLLTGLDRLLTYLATPFGVHFMDPRKRFAILLGIYAVIYVLGFLPIPVMSLVALTVGYVGVLAVGRAWVLNEKERTLIAKKLKDGDPDTMPDLRWTALVSALQLLILWPLIFMQVQRHFGLYAVPKEATVWTWVAFTLDSYNKAFLGLLQVYGVHFEEVRLDSAWGRHLVTLCRLTFDFLLIQGVFRILAIRQTIREAVLAVKTDPDMAVRLGRRAVKPLQGLLQSQDVEVRRCAVKALGRFSALEPLCLLLRDQDNRVRKDVVQALGRLGRAGDNRAGESLLILLQDQDAFVRSSAARELGQLEDVRAVEPLIHALQHQDSNVRISVAGALGGIGDKRAVEPLLALLDDRDSGVRKWAAEALGVLGDDRAVEPLLALLHDQDSEVRSGAAEGLASLVILQQGNARIVDMLLPLLRDQDKYVRACAAHAVGRIGCLGDGRAIEPLIEALQDEDSGVRTSVAEALGRLGDSRAVESLIEATRSSEANVREKAIVALKKLNPVAAAKAELS